MRKVWHQLARQSAASGLFAACTCILLGLLVAGCGSTASAKSAVAATVTPTCPPVVPTKSITGSVKSVSSGSFTVTTTAGASATVHLTSNTLITHQIVATVASLTTGQAVEVSTDSSGVTALRVVVIGTSGGGGTGTRRFGGSGTPTAGRNASCFRRGAGSGFAPGAGAFSGIRGTLTSVSSNQLVLTDSQGQSYTVAVTSSTVITSLGKATASDLVPGDPVTASGPATSDGITARTLLIGLPPTSNS